VNENRELGLGVVESLDSLRGREVEGFGLIDCTC
jgi:hypothetical protein